MEIFELFKAAIATPTRAGGGIRGIIRYSYKLKFDKADKHQQTRQHRLCVAEES
jgi:hypothetical protein